MLVISGYRYQMPIALVGLISSLALWDLLRFCSDKWRVDRYPVVRQALIHTVQCGELLFPFDTSRLTIHTCFCIMGRSIGSYVAYSKLLYMAIKILFGQPLTYELPKKNFLS